MHSQLYDHTNLNYYYPVLLLNPPSTVSEN